MQQQPKRTSSRIQAAAIQTTCPTGTKGSICSNDCSTLLTCAANNPTPVATFSCKDLNSNTPYCNDGLTQCTSYGYSSNCAREPLFVCTDTGYFPDPKNNDRYFYCHADGRADMYYCPYNYVYDSFNKRCKYAEGSQHCGVISCSYLNKFPGYISYLPHPAFYALCTKTGDEVKTTMLKCADERFAFNTQTYVCEFDCLADGLYQDFTNCRRYYECYRDYYGKYYPSLKTCPSGTRFDVASARCVAGSC